MTDKNFYTATAATDTLPTYRDNVEASLGKARQRSWATYSSAQTLGDSVDYVNADASGGAFTITLPASPADGDEYVIRKSDSSVNAVTVDGNSNDIDGSASASLSSQYDRLKVSWDGSEWARVD